MRRTQRSGCSIINIVATWSFHATLMHERTCENKLCLTMNSLERKNTLYRGEGCRTIFKRPANTWLKLSNHPVTPRIPYSCRSYEASTMIPAGLLWWSFPDAGFTSTQDPHTIQRPFGRPAVYHTRTLTTFGMIPVVLQTIHTAFSVTSEEGSLVQVQNDRRTSTCQCQGTRHATGRSQCRLHQARLLLGTTSLRCPRHWPYWKAHADSHLRGKGRSSKLCC
ncbi:hypothetical protein EDD37DRAFT_115038 [Exophiala viscosa]|uniref:uncharacterized protein n=1 Tax=Exophiala viscosa TaxID=2486360 RepID=UPI0021977B1D|nr:hypothetical protein EDD37DRAFT_115038 [Exophiala viscosa]